MLSAVIFVPLAGAALLYLYADRRYWRIVAIGTSAATLVLAVVMAALMDRDDGSLQFEQQADWIPSLGASYHVGIDGISLPLILLTALLTFLAVTFLWDEPERPREFFALVLVMETGLLGVFSTLDLLLFYLFWEVALVPMYFIIGVWGYERRVEAALKFFLYTRAGSLAMLLAILGVYLAMDPRTFDLTEIAAADPRTGTGLVASLIMLGFFVGFAVKLPVVPFHSWLPDAHTEAPTAGSVLLAGLLLKMGGYGFLRLALPTVPDAFEQWAAPLAALGVASAIYGAVVSMAQTDLKRLIAFSSVNHMGYVMLAVAVAAAATGDVDDRTIAATGAVYMMVAHGLVTGGLFFLVGMLSARTGTRDIGALRGLWVPMPLIGTALAFAMFASFGLPTLANFAAEVQILLGALGVFPWAAGLMLVGIIITTAMFLWTIQRVLFGSPPADWLRLPRAGVREVIVFAPLAVLIVYLGVAPGVLVDLIDAAVNSETIDIIVRSGSP